MQKFERYMSISDRKKQVYAYLGKVVTIKIDRPINTPHPKHPEILYPINYGYIENVFGGDNEELDVYLLGVDEIVSEYEAKIIAIVHRHNDEEDKLVAAPINMNFSKAEIISGINFQEQFYNDHVEMIDEYNMLESVRINAGFSSDKKYLETDKFNHKYFTRVSEKKSVYHHLFLANALCELENEISMPKLLNIKYEEDSIKSIYEWIEGKELSDVILTYSKSDQYAIGIKAGQYLKKIHAVKCIDLLPSRDWESFFIKKMNRNIENYTTSNLDVEGTHYFIDYINNNQELLKDRPLTFQHGDFHINNMLIKDDELFIIDFDRYDIGDPWEEFNRIVWSFNASEYFASGIINGYFNHLVPDEFWPLMLLYISSNSLSSLTWALTNMVSNQEIMHAQIASVLKSYDNLNLVIPKWYIEKL